LHYYIVSTLQCRTIFFRPEDNHYQPLNMALPTPIPLASQDHHGGARMSDPIRFYYRGAVHAVANASPTQTVLQHLREDLHCTGTKEGCAEGDCGACTVVVGVLQNGKVELSTVNACIQLLPMLDGKALFTVEDLKQPDANAEAALNGQPWNEATLKQAMLLLAQDYAPLTDMRTSGAYRMKAAQNLLRRFWLETRTNAPLPAGAVNVFSCA